MGIGVYLYSDLATKILLGSQWNEASRVIGLWAITSSITIVFSYFNSEVYLIGKKRRLDIGESHC